jgi:hypothetical protein
MALKIRMRSRRAGLREASTHKGERDQSETHHTPASVGSAERISQSALGAVRDSVVGEGGDHHTDGAAGNRSDGSDHEGEGRVSCVERLDSAINDEEHDSNKDDADQVLLLQELLGALQSKHRYLGDLGAQLQ